MNNPIVSLDGQDRPDDLVSFGRHEVGGTDDGQGFEVRRGEGIVVRRADGNDVVQVGDEDQPSHEAPWISRMANAANGDALSGEAFEPGKIDAVVDAAAIDDFVADAQGQEDDGRVDVVRTDFMDDAFHFDKPLVARAGQDLCGRSGLGRTWRDMTIDSDVEAGLAYIVFLEKGRTKDIAGDDVHVVGHQNPEDLLPVTVDDDVPNGVRSVRQGDSVTFDKIVFRRAGGQDPGKGQRDE